MEVRDRPRAASWVWAITAALCAAIVVAMAVRAVRAHGGFDDPAVKSLALALLAILLGMTIGALVAWRRDQRAAGALVRAALRARDEADGSIDVVRSELDAERARSRGLQQRHAVEARWVDELRQKVAELHKRHGALGAADVGELVLRVAVELTEASRGLLLEQRGDSLEVAHAHGFDPDDPAGSQIIGRLARQTLRRDETLRDDDPDGELDNLVAIPVYVTGELTGVVVCADRPGGFAEVEDEVLLALGDHAGAVLQHGRLRGELRSAYLGT